ncbi:metallopeptidase family protein [Corynebacterium timonense]|uniref:Zinicin-like metallopeptidase n=1 Tax=Corynebacterium timonense TaxID=441500 RepID=A0A1H1RSU3_9CORY|nr:metallopeptidase family protein [Corynebacterium timonense]SDS38791.1 hypothetical protein SAMN04488539_1577 [Corynebacterium timonense]
MTEDSQHQPLHLRPARDRHARGARGPLLPVGVPRYRTRSTAFDQLVLEAYAPLHNAYFEQLAGVDLAVDTIPRMRLRADSTVLPDEIVADGPVPLGRVLQAGVDRHGNPTRARFVVFRMPVERRAKTTTERSELLTWVLTALVADYLNLDPRDIDPEFPW